MRSEFIQAVLEGTIKVADVDPSLQWGLVGGAAGGISSAIKSVATGDDLPTGLRDAALMGLLGAGTGAGISAGTRLLGYKPTPPKKLLDQGSKGLDPSVASAAGVGALGAGGLLGLSEARNAHFRNKSIGEFMYSGSPDTAGFPASVKGQGKNHAGAVIANFLAAHRKAVPNGPDKDLPGFLNKLLGRTEHSTKGTAALLAHIKALSAKGKNQEVGYLEALRKELTEGDKVLGAATTKKRMYVDPLLKAVRSPKGFLTAAGGLGLAHLGVSNLVHNLRKD